MGIEVGHSKKEIYLSQRKYALDLLHETEKFGAKTVSLPIEINHNLDKVTGDLIENVKQYQRLVGKLIYLTVTRPNLTYAVSEVRKYMQAPQLSHLKAVSWILKYIKGMP